MDEFTRARELIDAAHSSDPTIGPDGRPAELVYADRVESWVVKLIPDASPILRLAARCQHLERWMTPRSSKPEGKAGYFAWRKGLYQKQADRAKGLMLEAGIDDSQSDLAAKWIAKVELAKDPGTQALEDAAVLVFLENEIGAFASQHADYPREKFIGILRKTWRKLSPAAREAALALDLPEPVAGLVREAVG